jgi:hypothetical protein
MIYYQIILLLNEFLKKIKFILYNYLQVYYEIITPKGVYLLDMGIINHFLI